ncbi:2Fe-2S iron-sulfur cluster binding domain protein [Mycobacterium xenopi 4042]|uniref:2Fe-2S iron-sulfur cluster binding domain protein n=1 Tax=Mycobacterium xenopi 4042 TaxID=1299334 RepID=X7YJA5_MYCXE|nr:2Fe-2S iron-sulfur cluster binding domain protein [Mycobacterium xenopi 4042]
MADAATSLMDAGEQAGVRMPFGCRMGICRSCVVPLVDGHVRDLRTGVEHEPAPGFRPAFRPPPATACSIFNRFSGATRW